MSSSYLQNDAYNAGGDGYKTKVYTVDSNDYLVDTTDLNFITVKFAAPISSINQIIRIKQPNIFPCTVLVLGKYDGGLGRHVYLGSPSSLITYWPALITNTYTLYDCGSTSNAAAMRQRIDFINATTAICSNGNGN